MRRLLVLGETGQIARALAERAPGLGFDPVCVGRAGLDPSGENAAGLIAQHEPALVINAAAYTAVDRAETEAEAAFAANADLPAEFARACENAAVPFVQVSTDYVFDGRLGRPYREVDFPNPINIYGRSKLAGEAAVLATGALSAVVRTAWVYEARGANFVRTMLRLADEREEVAVVADQHGCPTAAGDAAHACLRVGEALIAGDEAARGVFHAAGEGEASWADLAEAAFAFSAALGGPTARVRRIATADYPTPAARPADTRLDCSKLLARTGWRPPPWRTSLEGAMPGFLGA